MMIRDSGLFLGATLYTHIRSCEWRSALTWLWLLCTSAAALKVTCPKDVVVRAGRGLSSARVRWLRNDFQIHSSHRIRFAACTCSLQ